MSSLETDSKHVERVYVTNDNTNDDVTCSRYNGLGDDDNANDKSGHQVGFRLLRGYRKKKTHQRRDGSEVVLLSVCDTDKQPMASHRHADDVIAVAISNRTLCNKSDLDVEINVMNRKQICFNCCKRFTAFLLSTVGLSVLTVAYSVLGGLLFAAVEAPNEMAVKSGVRDSLQWHVTNLWEITDKFNVLHPVS